MRETIVGAVTWIEEEGGFVHATLRDIHGGTVSAAAATGSAQAAMLTQAGLHGDQLAVVIDQRGIDLADPHDRTPSAIATTVRITWRVPRLGDAGPFGPVDTDNVVHLDTASAPAAAVAEPRRALAA